MIPEKRNPMLKNHNNQNGLNGHDSCENEQTCKNLMLFQVFE